MTPAANNPTIVLLVIKGNVEAKATNVAPLEELTVKTVSDPHEFFLAALGMPFNSTEPQPPQRVLSSAASKARYAKP